MFVFDELANDEVRIMTPAMAVDTFFIRRMPYGYMPDVWQPDNRACG